MTKLNLLDELESYATQASRMAGRTDLAIPSRDIERLCKALRLALERVEANAADDSVSDFQVLGEIKALLEDDK